MKRILYIALTILVVFLGVTFAFQNSHVIEINYYFGAQWSGPLSLVLLAVLALGIVLGYVAGLRTVIRLQRQLVLARREIRSMEQEVANLRSLPIRDVI